jgi:hypothetical protein
MFFLKSKYKIQKIIVNGQKTKNTKKKNERSNEFKLPVILVINSETKSHK